MANHAISLTDLRRARDAFSKNEPRDLFYRAATELVGRALDHSSTLTVAEALAVLLQTWNRAYYRYRRFDANHFSDLEALLAQYRRYLARLRKESIESVTPDQKRRVLELFESFEVVLGPVGAAKALHLLAPRLFPLWDRKIAAAYGVPLRKAGLNGESYWRFMLIAKGQCLGLRSRRRVSGNSLKAIDEYNYSRYTKGWLPSSKLPNKPIQRTVQQRRFAPLLPGR
jgi:hypothetical protein